MIWQCRGNRSMTDISVKYTCIKYHVYKTFIPSPRIMTIT